jgi:O-antigen ligase
MPPHPTIRPRDSRDLVIAPSGTRPRPLSRKLDGNTPLGLQAGARRGEKTAKNRLETLAVIVLAGILLYAGLGLGADLPADLADPSLTDHINPLNRWVWLGALALACPVLWRRRRDVLALATGNWPLLLLFAYFALSVAWALDPGTALRRLVLTLLQFVLFATLLAGIRRAPVLHMLIAGVCAAAALADLFWWFIDPANAVAEDGFIGLQNQKNQTGLLMMYGCLAAVPAIALARSWPWRALLGAATALLAALLIATRSATSLIVVAGLAAAMPALLWVMTWPRHLVVALATIAALAPAAGLLGYLAWCATTGADPLLPLRDVTFSARTDIWSFLLDEISKRPLLGAGYGSFWGIDPAVQPSLKSDEWFGVYTIINEGHDGYLDLLATGGVVGLAGGLFVLVRGIVLAIRAVRWAAPAEAAWREGTLARPTAIFHLAFLLGLAVHNFTESNFFSNNALLASALLICLLDLEKWRISTRRAARGR